MQALVNDLRELSPIAQYLVVCWLMFVLYKGLSLVAVCVRWLIESLRDEEGA